MGTNYYLHKPGKNRCEHCGRSDDAEVLHIGKSSAGWCFSLHVRHVEGIRDLDDWRRLFTEGEIRDEYGEPLSPAEMEDVITQREHPIEWDKRVWHGYRNEDEFHSYNGSQRGPCGMLRHATGGHCVGHGAGTWDLIVGDFS